MLSSRRLAHLAVLGLVAAVSVWGIAAHLRAATDNDTVQEKQKRLVADLEAKKEQQKQVQEETEKLISRLNASLQLLSYYQLDKGQENEILQQVTTTLSSLSQDQMTKVIIGLGKAAKAPKDTQDKELAKAYQRHVEIIRTLDSMIAKYKAIKSLDMAADQLDESAKRQQQLRTQTAQIIKEREAAKNPFGVPLDVKHQADEQTDLQKNVKKIMDDLDAIKDSLTEEQKDRLKEMKYLADEQKVLEAMYKAANRLNTLQPPNNRDGQLKVWKEANELQRQAEGNLQALARVLRSPQDKLTALKEAKARIDQAIREQENLTEDAKVQNGQQPDKPSATGNKKDKKQPADQPQNKDPNEAAKALKELSDQQAKLDFDTRDTRNLLKPHSLDLAAKVYQAENAMKDAEAALRKNELDKATPQQDQAAEQLKKVRDEIDQMIAKAEKQNSDPLTALKNAADQVERLIKEQKETKADTQKAESAKQMDQLPQIGEIQKIWPSKQRT